jgi:hypothetical protein
MQRKFGIPGLKSMGLIMGAKGRKAARMDSCSDAQKLILRARCRV